MGKNKKKIAFITCVNNEDFYNECVMYINRLTLPKGFVTELIPIYNAPSMTAGYNIGMAQTDAMYKIFLHQDVFIINPNFLNDILFIFKQNRKVGMIGVVGSPELPASGVQWHGERVGNLYFLDRDNTDFNGYEFSKNDEIYEVQAIDGLIMITKEDIPWREDIFDGWDFYDTSQSFEYRSAGFKVVVPQQTKPWCAHFDGDMMNLWNYDKYRKIFLNEYIL